MNIEKFENLVYATEIPKILSFITMGMLRKLIFNAQYNGFDKVIVRIGRRILIDLDKLYIFLQKQNLRWSETEVQTLIDK